MAGGVALEALTALTGVGGAGLSSFCDKDVYTGVELLYPAVYAALMLVIRSRLRRASVAQWLDGSVVGLAVAALAAALSSSGACARV